MITKENVRDLFDYRDGSLYWKVNHVNDVCPGDRAGCKTESFPYETLGYGRKNFLTHRIIYLWHHGECPSFIDHIDQDKTNNRIENLRPTNKSKNAHNSDHVNSSSGYRGVRKKSDTQYLARIRDNYKEVYLGTYRTAEEASAAYEAKRKQLLSA